MRQWAQHTLLDKIVVSKTHISPQASSPQTIRCLSVTLSFSFSFLVDVSLQLAIAALFSLSFLFSNRLFVFVDIWQNSIEQIVSLNVNELYNYRKYIVMTYILN